MEEPINIRSCIRPDLMRRTVWRGTVYAGIGAMLLVLSGAFFSPEFLSRWGFLIFLVGMAFIIWGLLPYKKLRRLEMNPSVIRIEDGMLNYIQKGKCVTSIPINTIARCEYYMNKDVYGVGIMQKKNIASKKLEASSKEYGYDLFFPYFSESSVHKLIQLLD